jgi:hypothetical protein
MTTHERRLGHDLAHGGEDGSLERADIGEHGPAGQVRRERLQRVPDLGQRHRQHHEIGAVHGGGVGGCHGEAGDQRRVRRRGVDVVADDLASGMPHCMHHRAADQTEAEHRDAVEIGGHAGRRAGRVGGAVALTSTTLARGSS